MAVKITKNKIKPSLGRIEKKFTTVPKRAFAFWRKITPKRTGNAKRRTRLNKNVIEARYPYAQRLDEGWSRQAPQGMYKPTLEYIRKITKRMVRK